MYTHTHREGTHTCTKTTGLCVCVCVCVWVELHHPNAMVYIRAPKDGGKRAAWDVVKRSGLMARNDAAGKR